MKNRVGNMLGQVAEGMPWMGTFHSISVKILRRNAELVGLKSNFTILDTDDQLRLLKQLIKAENIDDKRWPARLLAGLIDRWKNRSWLPAEVPSSESAAYNNQGTEIYEQYQKRLKQLNAVDFGDLLLYCVEIFKKNQDILENINLFFVIFLLMNTRIRMLHNTLWLRLLAGDHKIFVGVGDDDQSIYGWRC